MENFNLHFTNTYGRELFERIKKYESEIIDICEFICFRKKEGMPYSDLELKVCSLKQKIEHCTNEFMGYNTKENVKL